MAPTVQGLPARRSLSGTPSSRFNHSRVGSHVFHALSVLELQMKPITWISVALLLWSSIWLPSVVPFGTLAIACMMATTAMFRGQRSTMATFSGVALLLAYAFAILFFGALFTANVLDGFDIRGVDFLFAVSALVASCFWILRDRLQQKTGRAFATLQGT